MLFSKTPEFNRTELKLGTTFSQLQCKYLGLDYKEAFENVLNLDFDIIRLCTYWNEIESKENHYDTSIIEWLLNKAAEKQQDVILAIGIKTPRWPEFHIPKWLEHQEDTETTTAPLDKIPYIETKALEYAEIIIKKLSKYPNIKYYQIENEPFNKMDINKNRSISYDFVKKEIEIINQYKNSDQKIFLTNAIYLWPPFTKEDEVLLKDSISLGDAIGINVYAKVPSSTNKYLEPTRLFWPKLKNWNKMIVKENKEAWISELQAEPWEQGAVHIDKLDYPSSNPLLAKELLLKTYNLGYTNILLWGCEHWYWHKKFGDSKWWETFEQILKKRQQR